MGGDTVIRDAGTPRVNTTINVNTTNVTTQLTNAGWIGNQSATYGGLPAFPLTLVDDTNVTYFATKVGVQATFVGFDGMGNSIWTNVRNIYHGLPVVKSRTCRILANKYQFFIFEEQEYAEGRTFVAGGLQYIELAVRSAFTGGGICWWLISNGYSSENSGTITAARNSWRTRNDSFSDPFFYSPFTYTVSGIEIVVGNVCSYATCDGTFVIPPGDPSDSPRRLLSGLSTPTNAGAGSDGGPLRLLIPSDAGADGNVAWRGGEPFKYGTRIVFGIGTPSTIGGPPVGESSGRIRGQLWDAVTIAEAYPDGLSSVFAGFTFRNIMQQNSGDIAPTSLWVVS